MQKLVYVVDDEVSSLKMLVLLLGMVDREWQVQGFQSPVEALAAIKVKSPDLLISDQCMAEMSGEQLLEQARKLGPATIRIIISGYIDPGKLSKIPAAHQYIEKPFALHRISAVIRHTFEAQELLHRLGIHDLVTSLHSLPTMPPSYHMLLNALDNPNGSTELIAQIIATDAALTRRVLKIANSSFYARETPVSNPFEAVLCLGSELIKAIVISQQVFQQFSPTHNPGFNLAKHWEHCWSTAQLAQRIASLRRLGSEAANEAFLAGLLHELGELALFDNFPQKFLDARANAQEMNRPMHESIKETFGINPAHLTGYFLVLWGISKNVVNAVLHQYTPRADAGAEFNVTAALYVANGLAVRKDTSPSSPVPDWDMVYLQRVGGTDLLQGLP